MTDSETPAPPATPAKRNCLAAVFLTVLALAGIAVAIYRFCPWQDFLAPVQEEQRKLAELQQRLTMLEQIVEEEKAVARTSEENTTAPLNEEIEKLKARVDAGENRNEQTAQKAIASLFAYWDLRDVSDRGRPFATQLAALRATSSEDENVRTLVEKIAPYAETGAPPLPALREELIQKEKNIPAAEDENAAAPSIFATIKKRLRPLIFIHNVRDPRMASIEQALAAHDATGAMALFKTLPENVQSHLEPWRLKLESRIGLDEAVKSLMKYYATLPEPKAAP